MLSYSDELWQGGVQEGMQKGLQKGLLQGRQEGKLEAFEEVAVSLLDTSLSAETIAEKTGVSVERIRELAKNRADNQEDKPSH